MFIKRFKVSTIVYLVVILSPTIVYARTLVKGFHRILMMFQGYGKLTGDITE